MQHEIVLSFFAKYIENELGIIYASHNYFQLESRLEEIARRLGCESLQKLREKAEAGMNSEFRQLLLDSATNNETSFFRDPKIFSAIEEEIIPKLLSENPFRAIRIWSAASSSGQEALSISMLLLEMGIKSGRKRNFEILGTDISERVLQKAKSGRYTSLETQRGLPESLLSRYFMKIDSDHWGATEELMKPVTYKNLNLKSDFGLAGCFDLVLCRNVLIYQNVQSKKEILGRVTDTLVPGGFLILGSGESLLGLSNDYEQVLSAGAVLYRKKNKGLLAA